MNWPTSGATMSPPETCTVSSDIATTGLAPPVLVCRALDVVGRPVATPIAPLALERAMMFPRLRELLKSVEGRASVTQGGGVSHTFFRGRRFAVVEADPDGEVIVTLTDRASFQETYTDLFDDSLSVLAARILKFLMN